MTGNDFRTYYTRQLWEDYVKGEPIAAESLPDYVFRSWEMCRKLGLNPRQSLSPRHLGKEELAQLLEKNRELLEIAQPVLNMLLFSTSESQFIVMLTAANGVILSVAGDTASLSVQESYYNKPGVSFDEDLFCVRATTLALHEKIPVSLCGSEHYLEVFHNTLCYAAPIFDYEHNVLGCISLATSLTHYSSSTLAMITAAAENIGSQLQKKYLDSKKNYLNSLVFFICECLPDGIVALDPDHRISYVNQAMEEILRLPGAKLLGSLIADHISPASMEELLHSVAQKKRRNFPMVFSGQGKENRYLCRVQPLQNTEGEQVGNTLFIATDKQILQGISHVGGNRAYYRLDDIQGQSPQIKKSVQLAKKLAKNASRILLVGESGTGKELFAQAIHNEGPRHSQPFVAISCASIPRELVEAELFGYMPGAFTGASKSGEVGKFELAHNGTLFLDEINSLPIEAQGKLLRALQQEEITRIGGKAPIPVNVHVISACNVNLRELVKTRMFREDLYYRLNRMEINIPPLRERSGDVEYLIKHFIGQFSKTQNRVLHISSAWMDAMLAYSWPGNVRELEHACEYSMLICEGDTLDWRHIPPALAGFPHHEAELATGGDSPCEPMDQVFHAWLMKVLDQCQGNLLEASKQFGISRSTLYRKMYKFGIDPQTYRQKGQGRLAQRNGQ